ncbi:HlyD family type I secretion periplasmic adaptor subunit [Paraburkholderia hayleyella]|uniref:HlyD family type I secretion periplasmic adaptor subunit n=1 Tax=Paraburkholderia hayleyella TaxID=2152889 RepID=UPI003CCD4CF4
MTSGNSGNSGGSGKREHASACSPAVTVQRAMPFRGSPSAPPAQYTFAPEQPLPRSALIVWLIGALLMVFLLWAWQAQLEEVSTGTGKVVPSSKEQIIQSLEGGILIQLKVKEGDIVEAGQVLAQLDRTRNEAAVGESAARMRAALAMAARLTAEVNNTPLVFPAEVQEEPDLVRSETALYHSRRESLSRSLSGIGQALTLVRRELALTRPLVARGAASDVEVLRLERQINELDSKATDLRTQYLVKAREELARANAEIESQRSVTRGRNDSLTRLTFTSPVRGVVKDIAVTTLGGVVPPNGKLMEIVPLGDKLLIEARIAPRDVAFIHPGQAATVKISAYDYSIYGGLPGRVTTISPDTLQDEVKRETFYYRVYIRTDADHLSSKRGQQFSIVPGMIASVEIHTGQKTVLDYLVKPFNKAQEALRER